MMTTVNQRTKLSITVVNTIQIKIQYKKETHIGRSVQQDTNGLSPTKWIKLSSQPVISLAYSIFFLCIWKPLFRINDI